MQLTRMQGKTVMSCQRQWLMMLGCGAGVMFYNVMHIQCNGYICFIYNLAKDAGGAGGVMTPGLLTSPSPLPGPGGR